MGYQKTLNRDILRRVNDEALENVIETNMLHINNIDGSFAKSM